MRTTIDIPDDLHRRLKAAAAKSRCSMRAIIIRSIQKEIGGTSGKRRVRLPIVKSREPGTLQLTDEQIAEAMF